MDIAKQEGLAKQQAEEDEAAASSSEELVSIGDVMDGFQEMNVELSLATTPHLLGIDCLRYSDFLKDNYSNADQTSTQKVVIIPSSFVAGKASPSMSTSPFVATKHRSGIRCRILSRPNLSSSTR